METLFTEDEAAAYLRIDPRGLARLRRAGRIGVIQVTPRRYLYTEAHLREYLNSLVRQPASSPVDDVIQPRPQFVAEAKPSSTEDRGKPRVRSAPMNEKVSMTVGRPSKRQRIAPPDLP